MPNVTDQLKVALVDRYVIEKDIGEGGMATVYLAHDVKHDRKVALKVLRPELAAVIGAERFLQEIKVTANLQHPHILPLHDSGTVAQRDGGTEFLYYVMPFIEGESLRDKLDREKQLAVDEALKIAGAVAAALDYAHRQDVVHRDIKPENILLHDGQALVADFGIALAISQAGSSRLTDTGLSIGTPHYMSPEQAMGDRELDARSDVYSLGAMLYEMLVGEPPFTGPTAQSIVAKVITEKPPALTALRPTAPPHVAVVVGKALEKLPADRFLSATEFAEALEHPELVERLVTRAEPVPEPPTTKRRDWRIAVLAPAFVVAAGIAVWGWVRSPPALDVARFSIKITEAAPMLTTTSSRTMTLSPDGRYLVYVGPDRQLFVRPVDAFDVRSLPRTQGAHTPFFSPDGAWVGFHTQGGRLLRSALAGGPPVVIGRTANTRGATWGAEDLIVFNPNNGVGLVSVLAAGGAVDTLSVPDTSKGEIAHRWPDVLPGGKAVLFTIWTGARETATVAALVLETGEITNLFGGTNPYYVELGYVVYGAADGSLLAVSFDADRLEVTGNPVALVDGVAVKPNGAVEYTVAENGTLAYLTGGAGGETLVLVDQNGGERVLVEGLTGLQAPRFSPEGDKVAYRLVSTEGNEDIWVFDINQGVQTRLTFEGINQYPAWMPHGDSIVFTSDRGGDQALYVRAADHSGEAQLLLARDQPVWEVTWGRDPSTAAFRVIDPESGRDLWSWPRATGEDPLPYVNTQFAEVAPALSPDGRWLAYRSNESGRNEVYVRAFPNPSSQFQISAGGGGGPVWAPDGSEIYYRGAQDDLVAVSVQTDPVFAILGRRTLYSAVGYTSGATHAFYDVHPDGDAFVMVKRGSGSSEVIVVLNWFEELKARMGN